MKTDTQIRARVEVVPGVINMGGGGELNRSQSSTPSDHQAPNTLTAEEQNAELHTTSQPHAQRNIGSVNPPIFSTILQCGKDGSFIWQERFPWDEVCSDATDPVRRVLHGG